MATTTRVVTVPPELDPVAVFGPIDEVIRVVEQAFPELTILVRGNRVAIVSRSKQTEAQAAQAEEVMHTLIDEAYTAPMDADTVRRLLDRRVLRNGARSQRMDDVRKFGAAAAVPRNAMVESVGRIDQDRRRAHVPGVITFAAFSRLAICVGPRPSTHQAKICLTISAAGSSTIHCTFCFVLSGPFL